MVKSLDQRLSGALNSLESIATPELTGRLTKATGMLLEAEGCKFRLGQRCSIESDGYKVEAEVVGFNRSTAYLMPLSTVTGLHTGACVRLIENDTEYHVSIGWLGRVINALGKPIDGKGDLPKGEKLSLYTSPVNPMKRQPVTKPLDVGVRSINSLLTIGKGQRVGLMAGSGVGKSVLLGMMTKFTSADVVIVGLIGERGREVREFIEKNLGEDGLKRAIVVAAPADESPLMRIRATQLCHRLAEYFRDGGKDVLLLCDSLTRFAMAQREIALSLGEPPAAKGYPPSIFGLLPQLVERAGNGENDTGSMSAIYTVLADGDDQQDPIVDSARSILDGHFVLTRELAERGHYPAIDIGKSISRCMSDIVQPQQNVLSQRVRQLYSSYQQVKELIPLGAYKAGNDAELDEAILRQPHIDHFLRQDVSSRSDMKDALEQLALLFKGQ